MTDQQLETTTAYAVPRGLMLGLTEPTGYDISDFIKHLTEFQKPLIVMEEFMRIAKDTGEYVKILPENKYFPVLIGNNNRALPLFVFVEVLDELIDYDKVKEELPSLSHSQISGAISFLRKIAQYNPYHIDVDDIEDEMVAEDPQLLNELKNGIADQEIARVLYQDQPNG